MNSTTFPSSLSNPPSLSSLSLDEQEKLKGILHKLFSQIQGLQEENTELKQTLSLRDREIKDLSRQVNELVEMLQGNQNPRLKALDGAIQEKHQERLKALSKEIENFELRKEAACTITALTCALVFSPLSIFGSGIAAKLGHSMSENAMDQSFQSMLEDLKQEMKLYENLFQS